MNAMTLRAALFVCAIPTLTSYAASNQPGGSLVTDCATFASSLSYPDTKFTSSSMVAAGVLKLAGQNLPAHCLLRGTMHERIGTVDGKVYAIAFEMRLPVEWNGRYFYQANGGIDGNPATGNTSGGGPATDQFDLLSLLVDWVENDQPPGRVIASARGPGNPGGVNPEVRATWAPNRTRPLCAYPKVATYAGGDPEKADSFRCR